MQRKALFPGLVFDETDQPLETAYVGQEPCYVLNDAGFKQHIPAEKIDRQVLAQMVQMIAGNEQQISSEAAKMMGANDPFSRALIENQLKNIDEQVEQLFNVGIPEDLRAYIGMLGFKVVIDYHGQVIRFDQPGGATED